MTFFPFNKSVLLTTTQLHTVHRRLLTSKHPHESLVNWVVVQWPSVISPSVITPVQRTSSTRSSHCCRSRIWCLWWGWGPEDNVIVLAFSSSFRILDDMEVHNNFMIEESGPLSASYQIHHCDQDSQKPLARCYVTFQSWNWDHGSLTLLVIIFYAVFCSRECFSFPRYSLTNYLQIYILPFGYFL